MQDTQIITETLPQPEAQPVRTGRAVRDKKTLVEHSLAIDAFSLLRLGLFKQPAGSRGCVLWPPGAGQQKGRHRQPALAFERLDFTGGWRRRRPR